MKKALLICALILSAYVAWYLADRVTYAKPHSFIPETHHDNNKLKVGVIGDSWVAGNKLDTILVNDFIKAGFAADVVSSGEPGAKTKLIYDNIFKDSLQAFSSNKILHNNLDYCVLIMGVNDAIGQMGAQYYTYHVNLIIQTLLKNHIRPIVVTLPTFDIVTNFNELNIFKQVRNKIFSCFNNNCNINNISCYRNRFASSLNTSGLKDSVLVINFDQIIPSFEKDLYLNSAHLNIHGNQKMCAYIVQTIVKNTGVCPH